MVYDKTDLKVKELLGIDPFPNKCDMCGSGYQVTKIEINSLDGKVHCAHCHKKVKLGRVNAACLANNEFKMVTLRRKKK